MRTVLFLTLLFNVSFLFASTPIDNPVKTYYGNGSYPVWTDSIQWGNVVDMSTYSNGANAFEKFENARDQLYNNGGGVLYYPAGEYDFSDMPDDTKDGRGLMLKTGVVIRGQAPTDNSNALNDTLALKTVFKFPYADKGDGMIPKGWNYIGITPSGSEDLQDVNNVGVVWIETDGAAIYFGGEYTFGSTWATAGAWYSGKASHGRWADRIPDGTHPMDVFAGASGSYVGAGSGRLVMGCALKNSTVVNDDLINFAKDKGVSVTQFYYMYKFGARIGVYGNDVFVANNWLPKSRDCFKYTQTTGITQQDQCNTIFGSHDRTLLFDYGKTFGIDVNKGFLNPYSNSSVGYKHENVVIRDNYIYNHGTKFLEVSGKWLVVKNNYNDRNYLQEGDDVYGLGTGWELTLDGFYESLAGGNGCLSDNLSRGIDVSGAFGWIDSNYYDNTGSNPGNDGEGILWQAHGGMSSVESFAITNNDGTSGYMAGYDVSQLGALWAWNKSGGIGNYKAGAMYDVSIVENTGAITTTSSISVITSCPSGTPSAPTNVVTTLSASNDYVEISWDDNSSNEIGYRIDKKVGNGTWTTLVYRPRKDNVSPTSTNELIWRDYMPAKGENTYYRVVAINCDDDATGASSVSDVFIAPDDISSSQIAVDPFTIAPTKSGWETRYQTRVAELDNRYSYTNGNGDTDAGKYYWPCLLAQMKNAEGDATALNNLINGLGNSGLNSTYAGSFYKAFTCPGYSMYYFQYKDQLPGAQISKVQSNWTSTGRTYTSRPDHEMDPIYSCTEYNSENFGWMARLTGYLMAEEYNDQTLIDGVPAIDWYTDYVKNLVRATFATGRVEWNAHVYSGFCFQAALVVYEYAQDEEIRKMARGILDWMVMENALHYLDGNLVGPDSRDKGNGYRDFAGSVAGWNYVHFADDDFYPSLSTSYIDDAFKGSWSIGFIMQTTYRPPQAIVDIAQRKFNMPIEMHNAKPFYWLDEENYADWQGNTSRSRRFEFEFQYMDDNYLLASVASGRPSGDVGHFSEQSVWKLGVVGSGTEGACVLYGNCNSDSDGAGRSEYEQIGQYRNVQMRVIKGTDNMWTAIPDNRPAEISGDKVFCDLGNDVYVALIPYNSSGVDSTNDSKDDTYTRFNWTFNSSQLGALVMEVGTKGEHGSYANFKTQINTNTTLSSPGTDQVQYISTSGKKLKVQKMPNASYPEYCGGSYANGGTYPKVWTDDEFVDFNTWNSYEVVYGDKIVDQKWGMGQLSILSDSNNLTIVVDPSTAEVTWWKKDASAPEAPGVQTASVCGSGTATLQASGAGTGDTYRWYDSYTSTTPISGETANTYTTPVLTETTTYYVSILSGSTESMKTPVTAYVNQMPTDLTVVETSAAMPTDGIVAYMPLAGNTNDLSGNGITATFSYGIASATDYQGVEGGCYAFSGSSSYIKYDKWDIGFIDNASRSYSFRVYAEEFSSTYVFTHGYYSDSYPLYGFRFGPGASDDEWMLDFLGAGNKHTFTVSNSKNAWKHFVITYNGSTAKVYCDKVEVLSVGVTLDTYRADLQLGRDNSGGDFTGKIDEFVVYSKALSTTEIAALYETQGEITDFYLESSNVSSSEIEVTLHNSQSGVFYWLEQYPGGTAVTSQVAGNGGDVVLNASGLSTTDDIVVVAETEGGCQMILDTILNTTGLVITDVEEDVISENDEVDLIVYPNPTTGMVYFTKTVSEAKLYNLTGMSLKQNFNVEMMSMETLSPGIYILVLDGVHFNIIKE
jgi:hypothetical protein